MALNVRVVIMFIWNGVKIEQAQLSAYELNFFATYGFAYQNSLADIMRAGMALNVRIDMRL